MIYGVVSGGFDPLHGGHVRLIREASRLCDELVVFVNSDEWLLRKKGYVAIPQTGRLEIVRGLQGTGRVLPANDGNDSVVESLREVLREIGPDSDVLFMNGGDRHEGNSPENALLGQWPNFQMMDGVGGDEKLNSSSEIIPPGYIGKVERLWGHYTDHFRDNHCVFKTLYIRPGEGTSYQRHALRDEFWFVESGSGYARLRGSQMLLTTGTTLQVKGGEWHSITADDHTELVIREMQTGTCREDDIERRPA